MIHTGKKGSCPVCGNSGKKIKLDDDEIENCKVCGTVYNEFGIILTQEMQNEMMKNKIANN